MEEKPKCMRAFGWPEGTVRAILTLMFSSAVITICVIGAFQSKSIVDALKYLTPIATFMLGYYTKK